MLLAFIFVAHVCALIPLSFPCPILPMLLSSLACRILCKRYFCASTVSLFAVNGCAVTTSPLSPVDGVVSALTMSPSRRCRSDAYGGAAEMVRRARQLAAAAVASSAAGGRIPVFEHAAAGWALADALETILQSPLPLPVFFFRSSQGTRVQVRRRRARALALSGLRSRWVGFLPCIRAMFKWLPCFRLC